MMVCACFGLWDFAEFSVIYRRVSSPLYWVSPLQQVIVFTLYFRIYGVFWGHVCCTDV